VRAMKNRFGPVDEVGCFDLSSAGIVAITDPTGLFLDVRHGAVPGTCVAVAMEGRRPLLTEVQALVTLTAAERPKRTTSGVDSSRVAMILAILQQHAGVRLHGHDVFVSSVGGARLTEPSNDLAIALAIASAYRGRALGRQVVAVGELGLSGELRRVRDLDVRLGEAGRMGFLSAAVPAEDPAHIGRSRVVDEMRVVDLDNIRRALDVLGMSEEDETRHAKPHQAPRLVT
jgi:DNA repair protein RadA/Sms